MNSNEDIYSNLYLPPSNSEDIYSNLYLPNDKNIPENNNISHLDQIKNILSKISNFAGLNRLPPSMNIASGAISSFFPQEQREAVANLPQIAAGTTPTTSEKVEQDIGSYLPFGAMGGSSFLGSMGAAGAYGAANYKPGDQGTLDTILGNKTNKVTAAATDTLIAGLLHIAPGLLPMTKNSLISKILTPHDTLENRAQEGFEKVSQEVQNRGINKIPINTENNTSLIEGLNDYFPNTKASKKLLENASSGDYDSLRQLQSDLYTRGKKSLQSDLQAERNQGEEMLDKRNDINQAISDHLKNTGNEDLGNILDSSISDWKKLQDVYYNKNINNSIKKLVNPDIRKIPNNLPKILKEKSIPMQNFKDFHPGLENAVKKYMFQKTLGSKALQYGLPAGIGGATVYELMKQRE